MKKTIDTKPTRADVARRLYVLSKKMSKLSSDLDTWAGYEDAKWAMARMGARMQDWSEAVWMDARNENRRDSLK